MTAVSRQYSGLWLAALAATANVLAQDTPAPTADESPQDYIQFVREPGATCVARDGVEILVRSTHGSRTIRVWLDRYYGGVGTGDRSHTDLSPGGEPDPLGCSRGISGTQEQEWRIARAAFLP